jgi:hypothetical protein
MSDNVRLTGLPQATPNVESKDVSFTLLVDKGDPIPCVASYGVAVQIAAALGTALNILQLAIDASHGAEKMAVEQLQNVNAQRDLFSESVVLRLTTVQGIPYLFELPCQSALQLAEKLKSEAAKPIQTGRA